MKTFIHFIIKETRHILRDPRTVLILFGMPVTMILLFGFAISTDVKNVRTVVVTASMDNATRQVIDRLGASEYFEITASVGTTAEAERLICARKADMAVAFSPNYAERLTTGGASVQLIMDAADPNMAVQQANYARQTITSVNQSAASAIGATASASLASSSASLSSSSASLAIPVVTKMLYNPQMRSEYNFVPGIMGMLLLLICALMTSASIVREKERGTMDVLLVSPVKPLTIIVAKMFPYIVLSICILCCILLLSSFVLDVPVRGSLSSIFLVSLLYILLALSLGLLISTAAETQLSAMLGSAIVLMMPTLLLSGMIYPIESMPKVLQWLSAIVPARWYISAIRKLMIMGVGLETIATEVIVMGVMTMTLMVASLITFIKKN